MVETFFVVAAFDLPGLSSPWRCVSECTLSSCGFSVMSWRLDAVNCFLHTGQLRCARNHIVMHSLQNWCPQTVKTPIVKADWQMTHICCSCGLVSASLRWTTANS